MKTQQFRIAAIGIGVLVWSACAGVFSFAQGTSQESPEVQAHVAKAKELAGTRYAIAQQRLCSPVKDRRPVGTYPDTRLEPLRVFDNVYFLGLESTYAWAIDTPD